MNWTARRAKVLGRRNGGAISTRRPKTVQTTLRVLLPQMAASLIVHLAAISAMVRLNWSFERAGFRSERPRLVWLSGRCFRSWRLGGHAWGQLCAFQYWARFFEIVFLFGSGFGFRGSDFGLQSLVA